MTTREKQRISAEKTNQLKRERMQRRRDWEELRRRRLGWTPLTDETPEEAARREAAMRRLGGIP